MKNKTRLDFAKSIKYYNQERDSKNSYSVSDILMKMRESGFIYNNIVGNLYGWYVLNIKRGFKVEVPEEGLAKITFEKTNGEIFPKYKVVKKRG